MPALCLEKDEARCAFGCACWSGEPPNRDLRQNGDFFWSKAMNIRTLTYVASANAALNLTAGVLTVVPFALLIALSRIAWWPRLWLEPIALFGLPVKCIRWLARLVRRRRCRHLRVGMIFLVTARQKAVEFRMNRDGFPGSIGNGEMDLSGLSFHRFAVRNWSRQSVCRREGRLVHSR